MSNQKVPQYKRAVFHIDEWKPVLRGWIHAITFPVTCAAGLTLVVLGHTFQARVTSAIYVFTAMSLFGISALYHRFNWNPRINQILKRIDHTNIMLIIAGTYTPLAWLLLPHDQAEMLLCIVWISAIAGILFRVFWVEAPRWLYTLSYMGLGCVAVFYFPALWAANNISTTLIIIGGVLYLIGGMIYGFQKPNPNAEWFGFHELFHAFTVAAFAFHYAAVMVAVLHPVTA